MKIAVEVMKRGALTLLEKPCRLDELTSHIRHALKLDSERRAALAETAEVEFKLSKLTNKERDVLDLIAKGMTNKQIAGALEISIRAVEDRRSRLMKKMGARSVVEFVQLRSQAPASNNSDSVGSV